MQIISLMIHCSNHFFRSKTCLVFHLLWIQNQKLSIKDIGQSEYAGIGTREEYYCKGRNYSREQIFAVFRGALSARKLIPRKFLLYTVFCGQLLRLPKWYIKSHNYSSIWLKSNINSDFWSHITEQTKFLALICMGVW